MNKIFQLNLKFNYNNTEQVIHPVILKDSDSMVLVDCGYPEFLPLIEEAMNKEGLDCNNLTHVVITHQDYDHMGSLSKLKSKYPNIKVVAGEMEAPYITGQLKSLRLEQAEIMQETLPLEQKPFGEAFCRMLQSVETANVDILVKDGDWFDWCGGCLIISTPGHTPGHISLYIKSEKTIITGDAATLENDKLVIANPQFTLDIENAIKSLDKILNTDALHFISYHGGSYVR
ncbi:MAG: beta-lactamase domain protein [Anaerocolumna sp.]|jgi:glyoxylase-like metal-dependent hydrolase (beta-lactamase superfamily II)|nr:beta-lactamase domain protein [Anaerocolumna sp.]